MNDSWILFFDIKYPMILSIILKPPPLFRFMHHPTACTAAFFI